MQIPGLGLVGAAMASVAAIAAGARTKSADGAPPSPREGRRRSSHLAIEHDSLENLGHDWGQIAEPAQPRRLPLRVYLPQTTEDVARLLVEARQLGIRVIPRGSGHSSNDLTFGDAILLTTKMDQVLEVDEERLIATVQPGIYSARLDELLAARGLGLPVLGDHDHITVGGFASVGGVGVTSHLYGLFVDTVERVEYVTWDGEIRTCGRPASTVELHRLLCGTGQFGVITALTVRIIRIDKNAAVYEHHRTGYRELGAFIEATAAYNLAPGDAARIRGLWTDVVLPGGRNVRAGNLSVWTQSRSRARRLRSVGERVGFASRHAMGSLAGKLPGPAGNLVKVAGSLGYVYAPRYASMKNLEEFLDKVQDYSVGDPNRWLIIWVRPEQYGSLLQAGYELLRGYRERTGCFSFVNIDYRPMVSEYIAHEEEGRTFAEVIYYVGIKDEAMTPELMAEIVSRLDDLCIEHGAYRYMQSLTVSDPERRARIDPNTYWANKAAAIAGSTIG